MLAIGNYPAAATAFEALASQAAQDMPGRAPSLFMQAGRARFFMGSTSMGMAHFRRGLGLLTEAGRHIQAYKTGQRIAEELKRRGYERESREISQMVASQLPAVADLPTQGFERPHKILPVACSQCGGPLRPDEVEWFDESTAECPYCASPIRAQ
jgi:NAD-dependent SIR2 family protein deacetylase